MRVRNRRVKREVRFSFRVCQGGVLIGLWTVFNFLLLFAWLCGILCVVFRGWYLSEAPYSMYLLQRVTLAQHSIV